MARGDAIFGRMDVSLIMDARWRRLTAAGKVTYLTLYLTAVEHRQSVLDTRYTPEALSDRTGLDQRTYRKALQKCVEVGLIKLTADNRVYVPKVKENNEKLKWNDNGIYPEFMPHIGDIRGLDRQIDREIDREESHPPEAASPCLPMGQSQRQTKEPTPAPIQDIVSRVAFNVKADREPEPTAPEKQPTDADVIKALGNLEGFKNDLRKCIGFAIGKAFNGKHIIYDQAMLQLSPDTILNQCAFVIAWKEANDSRHYDAGAVLTNQFKMILDNSRSASEISRLKT